MAWGWLEALRAWATFKNLEWQSDNPPQAMIEFYAHFHEINELHARRHWQHIPEIEREWWMMQFRTRYEGQSDSKISQ